jgi:hypothetical protein
MNPILLGILQKAPEIITIAKRLADSVKAGRKTVDLAERVADLEKNEAQQAELVKAMARQINDMTTLIRVLNGRVWVFLTCSLLALVLAVAALVKSFAR